MPEYLPRIERRAAVLAPGESVTVEVRPLKPGPITITTTAMPRPTRPPHDPDGGDGDPDADAMPRTTALYRPGSAAPVAQQDDASTTAFLTYPAGEPGGPWIAKVTNAGDRRGRVTVEVAYPSDVALEVLRTPLAAINTRLAVLALTGIRVHLDYGGSFIDFAPIVKERFGLARYDFNLPAFDGHRVNDINSLSVVPTVEVKTPRLRNGALRLRAWFERNGHEIVGAHEIDFDNTPLTVELGLAVVDGKVGYDLVRADFPVDAKVSTWVPGFLVELFSHVSDKVERFVERAAIDAFDDDDVRRALATVMTELVAPELPAGARVYSVEAAAGFVTLKHYRG